MQGARRFPAASVSKRLNDGDSKQHKGCDMRKVICASFVFLMAEAILASGINIKNIYKSRGKKNKDSLQAASAIENIIARAQNMDIEELYKMAAEESNGKTLYCLGNSSRGSAAGVPFIKALQGVKSDYSGKIDWFVPKNNSIFTLISSDINRINHKYSMTLIQDGDQIQRKMLDTHYLLNYVPKEWASSGRTDKPEDSKPFALQTLNKVFEYNNLSGKRYTNCWDFVNKGETPLFMGMDAEPVGRNFLCMLTQQKYSAYLEDAYNALDADKKAYFAPIINSLSGEAAALGLENPNALYALAYIKLWCTQSRALADDGPICTELCSSSSGGKCGLLVYSKFRSIKESASSSVNNVTVAAYQDGYKGIGGFAYKHYLQVIKTAPLPWTACAFIAFMTTQKEGFYPWGRDMGGYCSNPAVNQEHSHDGYLDGVNVFPAKNDKGRDWWLSSTGGRLVVENPAYVAKYSARIFEWMDKFNRETQVLDNKQ